MKHFPRILVAELIKYKTKASFLFALMPVCLMIMVWLQMRSLIAADPSRNTWSLFIQMACALWGVFLFTPLVIFWATHSMNLEQRNWKLLCVQGVSRVQLLVGKLTVLLLLLCLQMVIFVGCAWIFGQSLQPSDAFPSARVVLLFQAAAATWPIIAVQLYLATWFRGYLPLILPALIGHFACLLGVQFTLGRYLPWSFTLEFLQIRGESAQPDLLYFGIALSIGWALTLLTLTRLKTLTAS